jgi:hypothetical protein
MLNVFHTAYIRSRPFILYAGFYKFSTEHILFVLSRSSLQWPPFTALPYTIPHICTWKYYQYPEKWDDTLKQHCVGFEVLTAVVKNSSTFLEITSCNPLKVNRRFGRTCRLHLQGRRISRARKQRERLCLPPAFTLVPFSAYSPTLKMEATCSSETSVDFQRTTRSYIPEDGTLETKLLAHS